MKVLSLFDGMACGMLAMMDAGIKVERYVAFEIDKYAVQTSSHNFPMIEHRGDVFTADFTEFFGFDWLVGGSPCTYWSIAQKNGRETEASGMGWELFSQYVRALREAQPRFFIYENNKSMSNAIRESITETFGFEPICINSALVSAQNRNRLYWVGRRNEDGTYSKVHVEQPEDRGILLRDILEGVTDKEKGRCVLSSVGRTTTREYFDKCQNTMVYEPVRVPPYGNEDKARPIGANYPNNCGGFEHRMFNENPNKQQVDMIAEPVGVTGDDKAFCLTVSYPNCVPHDTIEKSRRSMVAEPVGVGYRGRMEDGEWKKRYEAREDNKANALTTAQTDSMVGEPIRVGCYPSPDGTLKNSQAMRLYSIDGKSVNMTAQGGGLGAKTGLYAIPLEPMRVKEATKKGYTDIQPGECVDMTQPNSKTRRGRNMAEKSNCVMTHCQYYQYCGVLQYATPVEFDEAGNPTKAVSAADGKTYTVYPVVDGKVTIKGKQYPIKLVDGYYIIRKLTVKECMRLQTVPEWYEFPVSNAQAYKMLGNGWTVSVISWLIKATQNEAVEREIQMSLF